MLTMAVKNTMTKSNLVGGRVCLVYVSLLEASLREMRAGTKAEQRWEPGRTAEHWLTHPGFFLGYSSSTARSVCPEMAQWG